MKFIINADDYGLSRHVNEAIYELASIGTVSSTTVMVNMPYAEEVTDLAKNTNVGIGLHFNLTQGRPMSPVDKVSSLVSKDGSFLDVGSFRRNCTKGKIRPEHVLHEFEMQYKWLSDRIGERLDHLDSHQDINKLLFISRILKQFSKMSGKDLGVRVYNKCYLEKNFGRVNLIEPKISTIGNLGLKRYLKEKVFLSRAKSMQNYYAITDGMLFSMRRKFEDLLGLLPEIERDGVFEIMCHPAISTEGLFETKMLESRVSEYELLQRPSLVEYVKTKGLLTFRDLRSLRS